MLVISTTTFCRPPRLIFDKVSSWVVNARWSRDSVKETKILFLDRITAAQARAKAHELGHE